MSCFKLALLLTDTTSKVIFILINTTVIMTSVFANGIVMFVIITRQQLHQPTYYLIFSLAFSDFMIALFAQSSYTTVVALHETIPCINKRIITFLHGTSFSTSVMLLCVISRDRWLHVAKGLRYNEYTSNKQVIIISVACWLIGFGVGIPFCFEGTFILILGGVGFIVNVIACFTAICIINVKVYRLVKSHFNEMENNRQAAGPADAVQRTRSQQNKERAKVEQSVNRSILAVVMVYSIAWLPSIVIMATAVVEKLKNNDLNPRFKKASLWTFTLSYFNGAVNPFIYAYRCDDIGRNIRSFVFNMKTKIFPRSHAEPS